MYFDHFISPSLLELPQFRTITYNPDDISALKHLSDDELFDLYYLFYDTDPVQDDRGYLIRQIYTANINPIEPLQRPPIDNLGHSLNCKPSICHPIPFPIPRIDTAYHRFTIPYVAGSGAYAWLTCDCFYLDRSQIPLMSDFQRFSSCGNCKGSGGGCPVYSPHFTKFKPSIDTFFLMALSIDYKWVFKNVWKDRRQHYRNTTLMFLMYPDRMTENYLARITSQLSPLGFNLFCGNCRGCRPKDCTVNWQPSYCSKPSKRTFSMESVGVDCDALHYDLYEEWLPWFFSGTDYMPAYMTRYTGFFTKSTFENCLDLLGKSIQSDKSYSTETPPSTYVDQQLTLTAQPIPKWHHRGQLQLAYGVSLP